MSSRIIESLVPLKKLISPWDYKRWLLRLPTFEEVQAAPSEMLYYRNNWTNFVDEYPDQGNRGTCVAFCNGLDQQINEWWENGETIELSEEDLYWKARARDGLPDWLGEGSNNLGAMKAREKDGVCLESTYPTSQDKDVPSPGIQKPEEEYLEESGRHVIDNYYQVPLNPSSWKTSIAGIISNPQWEGAKPIVGAYKVTQTMIDYALEHDGIIPEDPGTDVKGGHSSLFSDYKIIDGFDYLGNMNTWNNDKFDNGWLWFPVSYLLNGIILEGWISHYGPPIQPHEPASDCMIANAYASIGNLGSELLGRRSRFKAYYGKKVR